MFTGITKGLYEVIDVNQEPGLMNYTVRLSKELCKDLKLGDSISVDGVCQTVVAIDDLDISFQAIQETLDKTTLNELYEGRHVSIERSLRFGDEVGGHEVSGHVFGTARIHQIIPENNHLSLIIHCDPLWMKYIVYKGFIAVDGSSLTVGETVPEDGFFSIHLIPETLRRTNFSNKQRHDTVNIEFDQKTKTIVDTIERMLVSKC
jgi:riboflavin synthase